MAVGILSTRRQQSAKPPPPYVLNPGSPQAVGLVGCYPAWGGSSTVVDCSPRKRNGTWTGTATYGGATEGWKARTSASTSSYIKLQDWEADSSTNRWSWHVRFRWLSKGANGNIVIGYRGNNSPTNFRKLTVDNWEYYPGGINGFIAITLSQNIWYSVTIVKDAGTFRYYRDGIQVGTSTPSAWVTNRGVYLNTDPESAAVASTEWLEAEYLDARLYNRTLNPAEVWALHDPKTRWELYQLPRRVTYLLAVETGTIFTRSSVDNVSGQDAYARLTNALRAAVDTAGLTQPAASLSESRYRNLPPDTLAANDLASRLVNALRAHTDSAGQADNYSRLADGSRQASSFTGVFDTTARLSDGLRQLSSPLGTQDVYFRVTGGVRELSDVFALADVFGRVSDGQRAATDVLGGNDSFTRFSDALRSLSDGLALADVVDLDAVGAGVLTVTASEFLGLTDTFVRVSHAQRISQDILGLAEATARLAGGLRAYADTTGVIDAWARAADALRVCLDSPGVVDTAVRLANGLRSFSSPVGTADAISRLAQTLRALVDTVSTQDTLARLADARRYLNDLLGLAETLDLDLVGAGFATLAIAEHLGLLDASRRLADAHRNPQDLAGLNDNFSRLANALRHPSDVLAGTDVYQRVVLALRGVLGVVGGEDICGRVLGALRLASDGVGGVDFYYRLAGVLRGVEEGVGLGEDYSRVVTVLRGVVEPLGLAESYARLAAAYRGVTDSLGLAEGVDLFLVAAVIASVLHLHGRTLATIVRQENKLASRVVQGNELGTIISRRGGV